MAVAVVVSTAAVLVVDFTGEASVVALSTAVVVSVGDVSAMAVSSAVAFVVAVLAGATGMATGAITDSLMMSSSAASAFRGGGAGTIRTDITRTITMAMDKGDTLMATTVAGGTVTTVAPVMDIAMAAERVVDMAMAAEPVTVTALAADQGMSGVEPNAAFVD